MEVTGKISGRDGKRTGAAPRFGACRRRCSLPSAALRTHLKSFWPARDLGLHAVRTGLLATEKPDAVQSA